MIKPIVLGNRTFPVNLIQGPLAGISCAPFRALTWRYSKPAFACTEMISCKTLLYQAKSGARRFVAKDVAEGPVCFQLSASDPHELAQATRLATDLGADLIDLNCGCPVKKIRRKGAGSSLLTNPAKLYQLIRAMKQNTHVPVSIKIRVQAEQDTFNLELAKVIAEAGADFLVVHGRHWTENYTTPCRYEEIQFFVEQLTIPVIGNGDVACESTLRKMLATGCAGVMLGRAGVGQPWLIGQLMATLQGIDFMLPSSAEIGAVLFEHVERLAELLQSEKFALLQARKFAKYYARGLPTRAQFCAALNGCMQLTQFKAICADYFFTGESRHLFSRT